MTKKKWKTLSITLLSALACLTILFTFFYSPNTLFAINSPRISILSLKDIDPSKWYFNSIQALYGRYGVDVPYNDNSFRPDRPATRGEEARWLNGYLDALQKMFKEGFESKVSNQEMNEIKELIVEIRKDIELLKQLN